MIEIVKLIYKDNKVRVEHGGYESRWMRTKDGLKQGCPLSSILFALYINEMESRLQKTEQGFRVPVKGNFWDNKARMYNAIPGLLFADDLAILARNWKEMDEQLKVASEVGEELEIKFNPKKSAVVIYCDCGIGSARIPKIQEKPMPIVNEYKYLGVLISNGDNILASQEKTWSKEAEKATNQLHANN